MVVALIACMKLHPTALVATACIAIAACRTFASGGTVNLDERRRELFLAQQQAAARAASGDYVGAVSAAIAPQGFYNSALATLGRGPEAARTFLLRDTLNARSRAVWSVVRMDVSADGNDGYTYGYLDVIRPNGETQPGAYKAYWRRGAGGTWQILALGRGRREPGPVSDLLTSAPRSTRVYKSWLMRDTTAAWATLKAAEVAFSDSSATNIRAAFMSFAEPDAGKVDGARYVFGREAIGEGFRNPPPSFNGIAWHAEWGTVSGSNDLGFNFGPVGQRNSTAESVGRFFTIWRRQADGTWLYVVD